MNEKMYDDQGMYIRACSGNLKAINYKNSTTTTMLGQTRKLQHLAPPPTSCVFPSTVEAPEHAPISAGEHPFGLSLGGGDKFPNKSRLSHHAAVPSSHLITYHYCYPSSWWIYCFP